MKRLCAVLLFFIVLCFSALAQADCGDKPQEGKTIEYKATNKALMVVNIGAHW